MKIVQSTIIIVLLYDVCIGHLQLYIRTNELQKWIHKNHGIKQYHIAARDMAI